MTPNTYLILRADGSETQVMKRPNISAIQKELGYDVLDTFNLRDGRVVLVSDTGMLDGLPVNPKATALYHSICKPGTVFAIHGDAAVVYDDDFA
jgi:hypothetical protein